LKVTADSNDEYKVTRDDADILLEFLEAKNSDDINDINLIIMKKARMEMTKIMKLSMK